MWKDFFLYTRSEQRGIIILSVLILMVLIVRVSMPYWAWYFVDKEMDAGFVDKVNAYNQELVEAMKAESRDSLFVFNPNSISEDELELLGFSKYQIKALVGYRNKVGPLEEKKDLLKVYGVDSAFYMRIKDYVAIPKSKEGEIVMAKDVPIKWINFNKLEDDFLNKYVSSPAVKSEIESLLSEKYISKSLPLSKVEEYSDKKLLHWLQVNGKKRYVRTEKEKVVISIELNSADTTQLKKLKGIGSKFSARIVNYRNALGGFYDVSQLKEVYGISNELYANVKSQVFIDTTLIKKIRLDKLKLEEISKHPYIKYQQAKELKNLFRKRKVVRREDVVRLRSIKDEDWEKIRHYLILEN